MTVYTIDYHLFMTAAISFVYEVLVYKNVDVDIQLMISMS